MTAPIYHLLNAQLPEDGSSSQPDVADLNLSIDGSYSEHLFRHLWDGGIVGSFSLVADGNLSGSVAETPLPNTHPNRGATSDTASSWQGSLTVAQDDPVDPSPTAGDPSSDHHFCQLWDGGVPASFSLVADGNLPGSLAEVPLPNQRSSVEIVPEQARWYEVLGAWPAGDIRTVQDGICSAIGTAVSECRAGTPRSKALVASVGEELRRIDAFPDPKDGVYSPLVFLTLAREIRTLTGNQGELAERVRDTLETHPFYEVIAPFVRALGAEGEVSDDLALIKTLFEDDSTGISAYSHQKCLTALHFMQLAAVEQDTSKLDQLLDPEDEVIHLRPDQLYRPPERKPSRENSIQIITQGVRNVCSKRVIAAVGEVSAFLVSGNAGVSYRKLELFEHPKESGLVRWSDEALSDPKGTQKKIFAALEAPGLKSEVVMSALRARKVIHGQIKAHQAGKGPKLAHPTYVFSDKVDSLLVSAACAYVIHSVHFRWSRGMEFSEDEALVKRLGFTIDEVPAPHDARGKTQLVFSRRVGNRFQQQTIRKDGKPVGMKRLPFICGVLHGWLSGEKLPKR